MNIPEVRRLVVLVLALALVEIAIQSGSAQPAPRSLNSITSQAEFDSLAVTYDPNTPYALPHALFVMVDPEHPECARAV